MSQSATEQPTLLERTILQICSTFPYEFTERVRVETRDWLARSEVATAGDNLGLLRSGILVEMSELQDKTLDRLIELFNQKLFVAALSRYLLTKQVIALAGNDADEFKANLLKFSEQPV